MKKLAGVYLILLFAIGLFSVAGAYAAEGEAVASHLATASLLEEKASEQDSLISFHERMKVSSDFHHQYSSATAHNELQSHCDAIIMKAKELKADLEKLAEWHRAQASTKPE